MNKSVVITGEGILSAIGTDCASVLTSLREEKSGIGPLQYLDSGHHELPVGEVKLSNDEMKKLLRLGDATVSRTALMAMLAVREALTCAGLPLYPNSVSAQSRIVLLSGTTVGGMDITEKYYADWKTGDANLKLLAQHDCGSSTEYVSRYFGIFDTCTTLSTACSSAANALMLGARMLQSGEADCVVAGGTEALTLFHLNGFNSLMILDHERCRPFDATRAGLNLGEGAAYVVMETEEHARARHASIHAVMSGWGNACDAYHQTASSADGEGAYRAMCQALSCAGLTADDIDYVNAHGTGTVNNDASEAAALQRIFGDRMPPVSSTKPFTGHATSASGSIEAVISLLALRHGFIPANLGWHTPMDGGLVPTSSTTPCVLHHVLCNSFGFGGNDTSLLFSSAPTEAPAPVVRSGQLRIVGEAEIDSSETLGEISRWVKPLEARRMGPLMKASLLTSLKALSQAGVSVPDAIVTATAYGCMENSEQLLEQLSEQGETLFKPTSFMQSTHNTLGSHIAIRLQCRGYNVTYTHGEDSLKWALCDAENLLRTGQARTVLLGLHDEATPQFNRLRERLGEAPLPAIYSHAFVLTLDPSCGS